MSGNRQMHHGKNGKPLLGFGQLLLASVLVTLSVTIAALFFQFLRARPVNVAPITDQMADTFQQLLITYYVPEGNIHRSVKIRQEGPDGRWTLHTFDVTLPPTIDWNGLRELLMDALAKRQVSATEKKGEDGLPRLVLALDRYVFAEVTIHPATATQAEKPSGACRELYDVVRNSLLMEGISPGAISSSSTDGTTAPRMDVYLPDTISLDQMKSQIIEAAAAYDVRIETQEQGPQRTLLTIIRSKEPCLEMICVSSLAPGAKPAPPKAKPPVTQTPTMPGATVQTPSIPISLPLPDIVRPKPAVQTPTPTPTEGETEATPYINESEAESPPAVEEETPTTPTAAEKPRLAIILDDGGYNGPETDAVLQLDPRLTLSVLPNTPHGVETAKRAIAAGFEVMLHMPMQTDSSKVKPVPGQLERNMDQATIERLTRDALSQAPGAKGVNNHTGAAFVTDRERVGWFMGVVKEAGLYFVDSRTTAKTTAFAVAKELGVPAVNRDVFLDNDNDPAKIRIQFDELLAKALKNNRAVGIGHFRKNTVKVMAELLPTLAEKGVELVHVSEILK